MSSGLGGEAYARWSRGCCCLCDSTICDKARSMQQTAVMHLNTSDILAIAAIVISGVAMLVGFFAVRKYGNRRRKILFVWEATPLVPEGQGGVDSLLKVTFRDFPVENPYLLKLRLVNVGPLDVASNDFDSGQSIVFRLNCTMYGLIKASHPAATLTTVSTAVGSEGVIKLQPGLLRRQDEWSVEAVVAGLPEPVLESPLVNTDIVEGPTYRAELARSLLETMTLTLPGGRLAVDIVTRTRSQPL